MCSADATKRGVFPDMRLTEARAECAELIWRESDDKLYKYAERDLVRALLACSPRVSVHQSGTFLLDASGFSRLGGEGKLCRDILRVASRAGFVDGQVGVADTAFSALVATRCKSKRWFIVPKNGDTEFLSSLPITHLPLSEEMRELLQELGVQNIQQLTAVSAQDIAARFGNEGLAAYQLACAIDSSQPQLPPTERRFESSVDIGGPVEALTDTLFLLKAMLDRLAAQLKAPGLCAEQMLILFYSDDVLFETRTVELIRPTNNAKFMLEVIRLTLESKPLQREFTALKVEVPRFTQESWEQSSLEVAADKISERHLDPLQTDNGVLLLQKLQARIGSDALVYPEMSDQYFHDKAGIWKPVIKSDNPGQATPACAEIVSHAVTRLDVDRQYEDISLGCANAAAPPVLRRISAPKPLLVRVEEKSACPSAIVHCGQWHRVLQITEPECLSGNWWDDTIRKAFYQALIENNNGHRALIALSWDWKNNAWLLEGVYD